VPRHAPNSACPVTSPFSLPRAGLVRHARFLARILVRWSVRDARVYACSVLYTISYRVHVYKITRRASLKSVSYVSAPWNSSLTRQQSPVDVESIWRHVQRRRQMFSTHSPTTVGCLRIVHINVLRARYVSVEHRRSYVCRSKCGQQRSAVRRRPSVLLTTTKDGCSSEIFLSLEMPVQYATTPSFR